MKKSLLIVAGFIFICVAVSSCRSHERCAAYGKIHKINTGKTFIDKTEKSI